MAKRAKMTAGEKLTIARMKEMYLLRSLPLDKFREDPFYTIPRDDARLIDAAIKRAANAAAWDVKLNQPGESSYAWMEAKYGPRPAKKARKK